MKNEADWKWTLGRMRPAIVSLRQDITHLALSLAKNAPSMAASEVASAFSMIRDINDDFTTFLLGPLKKTQEVLSTTHVPAAFEREKITTLTLDSGKRVTISAQVYVSLPAANKEAGYAWLRKNGLGDIIQETLNAGTLRATAKSLLEEGRELDSDLFTSFIQHRTSVTKT